MRAFYRRHEAEVDLGLVMVLVNVMLVLAVKYVFLPYTAPISEEERQLIWPAVAMACAVAWVAYLIAVLTPIKAPDVTGQLQQTEDRRNCCR